MSIRDSVEKGQGMTTLVGLPKRVFGLWILVGMIGWGTLGCLKKTPTNLQEEEKPDSDLKSLDPNVSAKINSENWNRFWKDLDLFDSLAIEEQNRIILFYDQLIALDPIERQRLWHHAELFSLWLNSIPEEERKQFYSLGDTNEKLGFVRKKREEQWLVNLPKADQDRIQSLDADKDERALYISRLKIEESERRTKTLDWVLKPVLPGGGILKGGAPSPSLFNSPRPAKFTEMPTEVQKWIQIQLSPRLTQAEQVQLKKAEGVWPNYPRTVYQLSRDHFLLPGRGNEQITSFKGLPGFLRERLTQEKLDNIFRIRGITPKTEDWPDFALSVSQVLKDQKAGTAFLGPTSIQGLPKNWKALTEKELLPKLDLEGKAFLRRAEGKWPDFPRNLVDMMMIRGIPIPGNPLPAPLGIWRDSITPN